MHEHLPTPSVARNIVGETTIGGSGCFGTERPSLSVDKTVAPTWWIGGVKRLRQPDSISTTAWSPAAAPASPIWARRRVLLSRIRSGQVRDLLLLSAIMSLRRQPSLMSLLGREAPRTLHTGPLIIRNCSLQVLGSNSSSRREVSVGQGDSSFVGVQFVVGVLTDPPGSHACTGHCWAWRFLELAGANTNRIYPGSRCEQT
jgi:hypothetical protein